MRVGPGRVQWGGTAPWALLWGPEGGRAGLKSALPTPGSREGHRGFRAPWAQGTAPPSGLGLCRPEAQTVPLGFPRCLTRWPGVLPDPHVPRALGYGWVQDARPPTASGPWLTLSNLGVQGASFGVEGHSSHGCLLTPFISGWCPVGPVCRPVAKAHDQAPLPRSEASTGPLTFTGPVRALPALSSLVSPGSAPGSWSGADVLQVRPQRLPLGGWREAAVRPTVAEGPGQEAGLVLGGAGGAPELRP